MQTDKTSIIVTEHVTVRSGDDSAFIAFQILPKDNRQSFWINSSPFIDVAMEENDSEENMRVLAVKAVNSQSSHIEGQIVITLDDGTSAKCTVTVLPQLLPSPTFETMPEIVFKNGRAVLEYTLEDMGDNIDESDISWYRVDNVDRSKFKDINLSKQSNETDCRKVAVSRDGNPCKGIELTGADIGKVLKVNIKPKHSNSFVGQGFNVVSEIITPDMVNSKHILMDAATMVLDNNYSMEAGYFNVRGNLHYGRSFADSDGSGLITDSMGCGVYYFTDEHVGDMKLTVKIEPECVDGNGFEGTHQYEDIYIKYNPNTQTGYGLRISSTSSDDGRVVFGLYQYKNGSEVLISEKYESDAFKPGCDISLRIRGDIFNAFITYDDGEDFSDAELRATVRGNAFGGFGFKHMAETNSGYRACIKYMEAVF